MEVSTMSLFGCQQCGLVRKGLDGGDCSDCGGALVPLTSRQANGLIHQRLTAARFQRIANGTEPLRARPSVDQTAGI
jgi:hypothetical protein